MSGLPVFTLGPACPFSNTREIHLLACYKAAYRTRVNSCIIADALIELLTFWARGIPR
jgi:hypothetical protein